MSPSIYAKLQNKVNGGAEFLKNDLLNWEILQNSDMTIATILRDYVCCNIKLKMVHRIFSLATELATIGRLKEDCSLTGTQVSIDKGQQKRGSTLSPL